MNDRINLSDISMDSRLDDHLSVDDMFLNTLFDSLTKNTFLQIFIILSLRFLCKKAPSKKYKKKYEFSIQNLEELYELSKVDLIKKGKLYLVPIKKLHLVEYFPEKFKTCREKFNYNDILDSFLSRVNYKNILEFINEEGGRSSAIIFTTYDAKVVLKTISKRERKFFVNEMLEKYLDRTLGNKESRLVRILGVFKINPFKQNVVLMENLIPKRGDCLIFDLKGSKVERLVKNIDPSNLPNGKVLKDQNFLGCRHRVNLGQELKDDIMKNLKSDIQMLKELSVVDYSILLGIYKRSMSFFGDERAVFRTLDNRYATLGIIDIFQKYNFYKAGEKTFKTIFNKKDDISIASPLNYSLRILSFASNIFE